MHFENGALLIFRWLGINVYLHWTWVFIAAYEIFGRESTYSSRAWNLIELILGFGIILLHEFGHAFACRQVGGTADRIMLWPLGGLALIRPPNRPGALLWSIAAGPLVNVLLVPLTAGIFFFAQRIGLDVNHPDLYKLAWSITAINGVLLVFNMLPIFPMDGGRILQALLWFGIGQAASVMVASIIGLIGVAGLLLISILSDNQLLIFLSLFLGMQAWAGIGRARAIAAIAKLPRHADAACPHCGAAPLIGQFTICDYCHQAYDLFENRGVCPNCAARCVEAQCIECIAVSPVADWLPMTVLPAPTEEQQRVQALFDQQRPRPDPGDEPWRSPEL